jgi:predicted dehydrogenase
LLQKDHNIIKVGLVGKRNFLPIDKLLQADGVLLNENNPKWLLTGGFESDLEGLHAYHSLNELLLKNDAVIINDFMHANFLELQHIIRHCKHVFISQAFPLSSDELRTLDSLASEAEVVVQLGLQHRFSDLFKSVKDKKIIPRLIETNHFTQYKRRSTHLSIISDVLLEDLDMVINKVNSDIKYIHATGVGVIYNDPDIVNIRLEFQNACIANLSASKIAIRDIHKTRFYQNDSYYTLDHLAHTMKVFNSNDESFWENTDESDSLSGSTETFKKFDQKSVVNSELDAFFNAVISKSKSSASLYDHLAIKFVAEQIYDQLERNFVAKCG